VEEQLGIIGILIVIIEIYRILRRIWIRRMLAKRKNGKRTRKPQVMLPKSEKDCPFCVAEKGRQAEKEAELSASLEPAERNWRTAKETEHPGLVLPE